MIARRPLAAAALLFPLSGCVGGMVASAAGLAAREARGPVQSNAALLPQARAACAARAAPLGTVRIIDASQKAIDRITVWGTIDGAHGRRSFECRFRRDITSFRLRAIPATR